MQGTLHQRIASVASMQRGCIARHQLLGLGIGAATITRLIERGSLHRLRRGVYAVGHRARAPLRDETVALLAVPRARAISHASAAGIWGLHLPGSRDRRIHLLLDGDAPVSRPGLCAHRSRLVPDRDLRTRQSLPVTSVAWTLIHLAESIADAPLERVISDALRSRLVGETELAEVASRAPGLRGAARVRAALADDAAPALTRSDGEIRMLELVRAAELPPPRLNVPLEGFEVDFHWPEHRLVVEVDSVAFHTDRWAYERDRRKDAALRAAGLTVIRITWRQLKERPMVVVAQLAAALAWATSGLAAAPTRR